VYNVEDLAENVWHLIRRSRWAMFVNSMMFGLVACRDEVFCWKLYLGTSRLLKQVLVYCYQPSCHNCFHVAMITFAAVNVWLQRWKHVNQ